MKLDTCITLITSVCLVAADPINFNTHNKPNPEFGSYMNPNPRTPCEGVELQRLNTCANDVLAKLDDCKADDSACECCALQSLSRDCYGLCPGSPSGSFLSVSYADCESLNDVNACGLPFKKNDGLYPTKKLTQNSGARHGAKVPDVVVKSSFRHDSDNTTNAINSNSENTTKIANTTNTTNLTAKKSSKKERLFAKIKSDSNQLRVPNSIVGSISILIIAS